MAKKAVAFDSPTAPAQEPKEVYESHNDATARGWKADDQCQCDVCQSYLESK